jgi:threonylcarbamoyladenosine tRNA methylthiotransferase MtaB
MGCTVLTLSFHTLGCKLNQFETNAVVGQFQKLAYTVVGTKEPADLVLLDTCTVTDRADQKARQLIRAAIRRNPMAVIVVMGCYSQSNAAEIAQIPGVDYILGNREKVNAPQAIGIPRKQPEPVILVGRPATKTDREFIAVEGFERQTRAYLKIQDGCDIFCSFCIVPFTRGRSRSMPREAILKQAVHLLDKGFREIVLTGVHIGDFGLDLEPKSHLCALCEDLLALPKLLRLRISSIEPWDITPELINLMAREERFCSHIHTAIQSGSNRVLERMKRRITADGLHDLFKHLEQRMPRLGLGSDVLVGFPGESHEDFEATLDMVRAYSFSNLHVFPYSEREGTRAASFDGVVPVALRKERCRILHELADEKRSDFHSSFLGQSVLVLLEKKEGKGSLFGFTPEYIRVEVPLGDRDPQELMNTMVRVHLIEDLGTHMLAAGLA